MGRRESKIAQKPVMIFDRSLTLRLPVLNKIKILRTVIINS